MISREDKIQVLKDFSTGQASVEKLQQANQQIKGEVIMLHTFYDLLKFTGTIGRQQDDFDKVVLATGEYRDFLEGISNSK